MAADHGVLLRNIINWAVNEEPPVEVTGPGVLDVTAWRQAESMTVHLVNLTNPMMMKGPFREIIPVGEQRVRIRVPQNTKVERVHLLTADKVPTYRTEGDTVELTVPSILDCEVIALDLRA
jgi:hypothetical protein